MECSFIQADAAGRKKTQEIIFAARLGDRSPVQGKTVDSAKTRSNRSRATRTILADNSVDGPVRRCRAGSPDPASFGEPAGSGDPALQLRIGRRGGGQPPRLAHFARC